jgi:hypothetical protein
MAEYGNIKKMARNHRLSYTAQIFVICRDSKGIFDYFKQTYPIHSLFMLHYDRMYESQD